MDNRESRQGKTWSWIRRREEKGYFNNIVQELMIKDTPGYHEMMRMTHDDFPEILRLIEPDIEPLLCFRLRLCVSSVTISHFKQRPPKLLLGSPFLKL